MDKKTKKSILEKHLGMSGRMISSSKGRYRHDNPQNIVYFNANVCTQKDGKMWYGDIDLTVESEKIIEAAKELNLKLLILSESDARFDNEEKPLLDEAMATVSNKGEISFKHDDMIVKEDGIFMYKKEEEEVEVELPDHFDDEHYKEEDLMELELPDLKTFKVGLIKKTSPHDRMFDFVLKFFDRKSFEGTNASITDFIINKTIAGELEKMAREWAIKQYKQLKTDEYELNKTMMYYLLNAEPSVFQGSKFGPEWSGKNCIYIKKDTAKKLMGDVQ